MMKLTSVRTLTLMAVCAASFSFMTGTPVFAQEDGVSIEKAKEPKNVKVKVYPTPQKMRVMKGTLEAKNLVLKANAGRKVDVDTRRVIESAFPSMLSAGEGVIVELSYVKDHQGKSTQSLVKDIPALSGAYRLIIKDDKILLIGYDSTGLFYGAQTLSQIGKVGASVKKSKKVSFKLCDIVDWPAIPYRGTIEGFYGRPWSFEDRMSLIRFYGKNKLNTYIYGPKSDPYHGFRSQKWREPYPADFEKEIVEMVRLSKANKVNFTWAIHPASGLKWEEKDYQDVKNKFEKMYALGVRSFSVFFDDVGGDDRQIDFLNRLNREFIHQKKDVTPLLLCPSEYNRAWSNKKEGSYLDKVGANLDKDINLLWTGNSVCCDITKESMEWINNRIKRKAFIWWNFPANDYVRHTVLMGRVYGLEPGIEKMVSGFASNPMDKAEASKVALFGVADFCWNPEGFNSEESWRESIKRLFPTCASEMLTFASHNSNGGPSGHNYFKEESVNIKDDIDKLLSDLKSGENVVGTPAYIAVLKEFKKIAEAPDIIRAKVNNPALIKELDPYFYQFERLGQEGQTLLELLNPETSDIVGGMHRVLVARNQQEVNGKKMAEAVNDELQKIEGGRWQKDYRPADTVIAPAVKELLSLVSPSVYFKISGKAPQVRLPMTLSKNKSGLDKMIDDDPQSFYYCKDILKVGDFIGLDLGTVQEIKTVTLVMGRNDSDTDAIHKGILEVSKDGKSWDALMPESEGLHIDYEGKGKSGRFVRYRATVAGVPGGKRDVWTAFRDFSVNQSSGAAVVDIDVPALKNAQLSVDKETIGLNRVMEIAQFAPKKYIGIKLPASTSVDKVSVDLNTESMDWAKLMVTSNGKNWKNCELKPVSETTFEASVKDAIVGVRLLNNGAPINVNLNEFKLILAKTGGDIALAMDRNLMTKATVKLGKEIVPFINNTTPKAKEVVVMAGDQPCQVMAQLADGKWVKIGELSSKNQNPVFKLKGKVKAIGFSGSEGTSLDVYEVIFK